VGPAPGLSTRLAPTAATPSGSDAAELLITNGMRLAPPEPSMLEARNAILEADTANGGDLHDIIWAAFAHRGMGYYASAFDGNDTHPAEDFNTPPPDGRPQGALAGRVFDSQTGLPLAGARVRLGAATDAGGNATLVDTTGADGRYQLDGVTEGTYGKLAVRSGSGGYDPVDVTKVVVRGGETTTKDVPLDRNWISLPGGARTLSSNDDTFDACGCGPDALIERRRRRLRLGGEQPELAGLSGRPQRRPAGVDVLAAEVGRPQRDRDRPGAGLLLPRRLGRPAGLQARGLVRRHDVPDAQGGLVHARTRPARWSASSRPAPSARTSSRSA
jgi:hypothetical protein